MPTGSLNPPRSAPVPWGVALAATSLLIVGGGAIIWTHQDPAKAGPEQVADGRMTRRPLPQPPAIDPPGTPIALNNSASFYSVSYSHENGTRVVKIRVVADGDELIVDAQTGRLLETRPSRPTAPPPMGRFVAPYLPM